MKPGIQLANISLTRYVTRLLIMAAICFVYVNTAVKYITKYSHESRRLYLKQRAYCFKYQLFKRCSVKDSSGWAQ